MSEGRVFILSRPFAGRTPKTIQRPRGGPVHTTLPPPWRCVAILTDPQAIVDALAQGSSDTHECQVIGEAALPAAIARRYEAEARK